MTVFNLKKVGEARVVFIRFYPILRKWRCTFPTGEVYTVDRVLLLDSPSITFDSISVTAVYSELEAFYTFTDTSGYTYFADLGGAKSHEPNLPI